MPEITVTKYNGFCNGVQRAVDTAMKIDPAGTYVFGEIIHNPTVVQKIAERGIVTVDSPEDVPDGARMLVRSHGMAKAWYAYCKAHSINIVDCTCPFVAKIHSVVERESAAGKHVLILGNRNHPEVKGIVGWCSSSYTVIEKEADIPPETEKECALVCQTTFSEEKAEKIIANIQIIYQKTVAIYKTLCYTTKGRQTEAEALSRNSDGMIVIGGRNSSNTQKLYEICRKHCQTVFFVEKLDDLDPDETKNLKKIGVVMGASTPSLQTQEVFIWKKKKK